MTQLKWWQTAVSYQIYLCNTFKRGFHDTPDKKLIQLWELIYKDQVEQAGVHQLMQEL